MVWEPLYLPYHIDWMIIGLSLMSCRSEVSSRKKILALVISRSSELFVKIETKYGYGIGRTEQKCIKMIKTSVFILHVLKLNLPNQVFSECFLFKFYSFHFLYFGNVSEIVVQIVYFSFCVYVLRSSIPPPLSNMPRNKFV